MHEKYERVSNKTGDEWRYEKMNKKNNVFSPPHRESAPAARDLPEVEEWEIGVQLRHKYKYQGYLHRGKRVVVKLYSS